MEIKCFILENNQTVRVHSYSVRLDTYTNFRDLRSRFTIHLTLNSLARLIVMNKSCLYLVNDNEVYSPNKSTVFLLSEYNINLSLNSADDEN